MQGFLNALTTEDARTENDALTHSTSSSSLVNLFFHINAMRDRDPQDVLRVFLAAFGESQLDAMRILFYSREYLR